MPAARLHDGATIDVHAYGSGPAFMPHVWTPRESPPEILNLMAALDKAATAAAAYFSRTV